MTWLDSAGRTFTLSWCGAEGLGRRARAGRPHRAEGLPALATASARRFSGARAAILSVRAARSVCWDCCAGTALCLLPTPKLSPGAPSAPGLTLWRVGRGDGGHLPASRTAIGGIGSLGGHRWGPRAGIQPSDSSAPNSPAPNSPAMARALVNAADRLRLSASAPRTCANWDGLTALRDSGGTDGTRTR